MVKGKEVFIWGTGYNATKLYEQYQNELLDIYVIGYIDNDPNKWGKHFLGKMVYPPDELLSHRRVGLYISINAKEEILCQIQEKYSECDLKILESDYFRKRRLMTRYSQYDDKEISEILDYLEDNPLDVFNYSYIKEYESLDIDVLSEEGLYYVMHNGRKLFFSRKYDTEEKVKEYYVSLLIEQDIRSPHRYLWDSYEVTEGGIVVDAGAAEGIFSLDAVEKAKKIYMFEPDIDWIEALNHTFAEYSNKVVIVNKCVSDFNNPGTTTIDEVVNEESIDYLKMDIEGEEYYALNGARKLIGRSPNVKCVVCAYHQEFAYYALKDELENMGLETTHSKGYMWYIEHFNSFRPMTLRRGIIRAKKS